jgi:hypothetical protein
MMAIAAAVVAGGSAHAALVGQNTGNSTLVLVAFNQVTSSYYVRDLGYTLNTFLPSSVTTAAGDGGVTGNKTPDLGLTLDKTTNASFADQATFTSWYGAQNAGDVRWTVFAGDQLTTGANGFARLVIASSGTPSSFGIVSNGVVRSANGTAAGAQGLATLNPGMGLSATGSNVPVTFLNNDLGVGFAGSLGTIGNASNLYYFTATTQSGATGTPAYQVAFSNPSGLATVLLASNGDFTYTQTSAVPLPPSVWMMGAGLAVMGLIRRRKAAAEQA